MAQTIKLKNSGTSSNTPSSLEHGELAINYADGKIFYKNSSNNIVEFANLSGSFLPLSGGTLTGNLSLGTNTISSGAITSSGKLTLSGTDDEILTLNSTDNNGVYMSFEREFDRHAYVGFGGSNDTFGIINEESGGSVVIASGNVTALTLDGTNQNVNIPNGSLMVGATTAPSAKLETLSTNAGGDTTLIQIRNNSSDQSTSSSFRFVNSTSGTATAGGAELSAIRDNNAGGDLVFKTAAQSTATLTTALTLDSSQNATFTGSITSNDGSGSVVISGDSNSNTYIASAGEIRIRPSGTTVNKFVIGTNGNLTTAGTISSGAITSSGTITGAQDFKATGNNMKLHAGGNHIINMDLNGKFYPQTHNAVDLGHSSTLAFKNLYLSNSAYVKNIGGVSDPDTYINFGDVANTIKFFTGGTERARLTSSGHLGIGTTTVGTLHGASYGTTQLHIDGKTDRGQMIIEGDTLSLIAMSDNSATANSRVFLTLVNDGLMEFRSVNDNGTSKATIMSMTSAGATTFSGSVSLLDNQLLMLGTGNDARLKFDTLTNALMITATNGTADNIRTQSNNLSLEQANGGKYISATANDSVKLYHADTPVVKTTAGGLVVESGMNFNMTGSMMIGATTAPADKLHVESSENGGVQIQVDNQNTGNASYAGLYLNGQGNNFFLKNWGDAVSGKSNGTEFLSTAGSSFFMFSTANAERMRLSAAGDLGINTTAPDSKLHITEDAFDQTIVKLNFSSSDSSAGNYAHFGEIRLAGHSTNCNTAIRSYSNAFQNANGALAFWTQEHGGSFDERMRILGDGKIGIGTASPSFKLDVFEASGNGLRIKAGDEIADVALSVGSAGTADKFVIQSGGNVGIGISSPTYPLMVQSDSSALGINIVGRSSDDISQLDFDESDGTLISGFQSRTTEFRIRSVQNIPLTFYTNNSERMRITNTGGGSPLIGIGTTSPAETVHIVGNTFNTGQIRANTGTAANPNFTIDGGAGMFKPVSNVIAFSTNSTERVRINSTGLGIGTTNPTHTLQVHTASTGAFINRTTASNAANLAEFSANRAFTIFNRASGSYLVFGGNSARTDIQATDLASSPTAKNIHLNPHGGNIGIGTGQVAPSSKLQIQGGTSGLDQISISSNTTADTIKYAGIIMTNYANTTTALIGAKAENGTSSVFYGSSGTDHRGIQNHIFYTNASATATSGNTERMRLDSSGNFLVGKTTQGLTNTGFEVAQTGQASATQSGASCLRLNRLTSDGEILQFRADGSTIGDIGVFSSDLYIGTGDTTLKFEDSADRIVPRGTDGAQRDNAISLGSAGNRWHDLRLGGTAYVGEKIGVGTTTVSADIHIENSSGATLFMGDTNGRNLRFRTANSGSQNTNISSYAGLNLGGADNANHLLIDGNGNVGIGVIPSSWNSNNTALQVGAAGCFFASTNTSFTGLAANAYFDSTNSRYEYINTDFATLYQQLDGQHIWSTAASGSADSAISFAERMRLDSSGRVLINNGVNLSAADADDLQVGNTTGAHGLTIISSSSHNGNLFFGDNAHNDSGSIRYNHTNDRMEFFTNRTSQVIINSSGNVGLGTTSPSSFDSEANNLVVGDGSGDNGITIFTGSNVGDHGSIFFGDATSTPKQGQIRYEQNNEVMSFFTNTSERMRLDLSGNLLIGKTAEGNTDGIHFKGDGRGFYDYDGSGQNVLTLGRQSDGNMIQFNQANSIDGTVGTISVSNNATIYATSSDARLKDNIEDADDSGTAIDSLLVRQFDWKSDGKHEDYGMIAQEVIHTCPNAVSVPQEDGEMMGIDYSKMVPLLLKEIQELRKRVKKLEE